MPESILHRCSGFTELARRALLLGQVDALRLRRSLTGSEHILLALLGIDEAIVVRRILPRLNIAPETVRERLTERLERGVGPLDKEAMLAGEMTPEAARVPDHARAEAAGFGCESTSTPYLLLGMLREPDSISAQVLAECGAELEVVRSIVAENPHE